MREIWTELETVYNLLTDDLSRKIYKCKVQSMLLNSEDTTIDLMYETYTNSRLHFTFIDFSR